MSLEVQSPAPKVQSGSPAPKVQKSIEIFHSSPVSPSLRVLAVSWSRLGWFSGSLGSSWGSLGVSWDLLGVSRVPFGPSWGSLGSLLGHLGSLLGVSWGLLDTSWDPLGASWEPLGPPWPPRSRYQADFFRFLSIWGCPREPFWDQKQCRNASKLFPNLMLNLSWNFTLISLNCFASLVCLKTMRFLKNLKKTPQNTMKIKVRIKNELPSSHNFCNEKTCENQ